MNLVNSKALVIHHNQPKTYVLIFKLTYILEIFPPRQISRAASPPTKRREGK
jgi:hypothetical protein